MRNNFSRVECLSRQYRKYIGRDESEQWQEWTKLEHGGYEWLNIDFSPLEVSHD